jgi:hypothetical protein
MKNSTLDNIILRQLNILSNMVSEGQISLNPIYQKEHKINILNGIDIIYKTIKVHKHLR